MTNVTQVYMYIQAPLFFQGWSKPLMDIGYFLDMFFTWFRGRPFNNLWGPGEIFLDLLFIFICCYGCLFSHVFTARTVYNALLFTIVSCINNKFHSVLFIFDSSNLTFKILLLPPGIKWLSRKSVSQTCL